MNVKLVYTNAVNILIVTIPRIQHSIWVFLMQHSFENFSKIDNDCNIVYC